jgi:hypothetical protein
MAERKSKNHNLAPIDLSSGEWLRFDWQKQIIIRNLQYGVADSIELPMPYEYLPENGMIIFRIDSGDIISIPLFYNHTRFPMFGYIDELFDCKMQVATRCSILPGSPPPKPKQLKESKQRPAVKPKASKPGGMLF